MTLCLVLGAASVVALPEDRLKAISISAERAERHERGGYTVYSGDVVLEQGSLHIEADQLTIYHDREAADRIIAVGAPARMRQQPAVDKGFVHASANRIVYEKSKQLVRLSTAASIEQDGAVVTGDSIEYFMAEQRVRADSAASDDKARVQVFIPADVIEEQAGDEGKRAGAAASADTGEPSVETDSDTIAAPPAQEESTDTPAPRKEAEGNGDAGGA